MKRTLLIIGILSLFAGSAYAQQASNGEQKISKAPGGYQIEMVVSPKKATALLVETIKSRQDTVLSVGDVKITVTYTGTGYEVDGMEYKRIADARKAVRGLLRIALGIL